MVRKCIFVLALLLMSVNVLLQADTSLPTWQKGWFEIHYINTKLGNSVFFIFPDGTTLLYDAGELPWDTYSKEKQAEYCLPIDSVSPGKQIVEYIRRVLPNKKSVIDYVVVSHFHSDHYGTVTADSEHSRKGDYYLSGITEVYEYLPFNMLIDRAYPDYDYPVDLRRFHDEHTLSGATFYNYLHFVENIKKQGVAVSGLKVGDDDQIALLHNVDETFKVRNIKSSNQYWTGQGNAVEVFDFSKSPLLKDGKFNENPLSIALLFTYGNFKYYIGGDTSGVNNWPDVNMEATLAPIIGEVDAMSPHHHGYKDATNACFLSTLNPQVIVQQSLHVPHFQKNVMTVMKEQGADVFALNYPNNISPEIQKIRNGLYKDSNAHIVIKVKPGGDEFYVDIYRTDTSGLKCDARYGPYYSRRSK